MHPMQQLLVNHYIDTANWVGTLPASAFGSVGAIPALANRPGGGRGPLQQRNLQTGQATQQTRVRNRTRSRSR
jgi:hypothetical protein